MHFEDDDDDPDEVEELKAVAERLSAGRLRLHRAIADLRKGRRTPDQRDAIMQRARGLVYKSILLRRKMQRHFAVH